MESQYVYEDLSFRQNNRNAVRNNLECEAIILELQRIEQFLDDFGLLSIGKNYIFCQKRVFSLQCLLTSTELTVGSIISCCESACIADANCLLRKYRDDLFFYLYAVVYDIDKKIGENAKRIEKMEKRIVSWLANGLSDFHIGELLQSIGISPFLREAVKKYNLQQSFNSIGDRLNNYVHSNGYSYYNMNYMSYQEYSNLLKQVLADMKYITVSFIFLLCLCSPIMIMSTDYLDYLDGGEVPSEGLQYSVAPFIEEFVKVNIDLIDKNGIDYLKDNTPMKF